MTADPVSEFERYRNELLAELNGDDPLMVLRSSLDEMERLLSGATVEQLEQRPAAGEWSPSEVLNHLADSDLVFSVRVRMMVTQDRPLLVGYDQEAWTERFGRDASRHGRALARAARSEPAHDRVAERGRVGAGWTALGTRRGVGAAARRANSRARPRPSRAVQTRTRVVEWL
jgi:hypothetical protein